MYTCTRTHGLRTHTRVHSSSSVKENCVVRLRGLPFQASLKDVQEFLVGLNVVP